MNKIVTTCLYMLHRRTWETFHNCMVEQILPLLTHLNIDVLLCGPSGTQDNEHLCSYGLLFSCNDHEGLAQARGVLNLVHRRDVYNGMLSGFEFYFSFALEVNEAVLQGLRRSPEQANATRIIEMTLYILWGTDWRPFHIRMTDDILPVLEQHKIDVVFCGPSENPSDYAADYSVEEHCPYALIRSYASFEERQRIEDTLYKSDEWYAAPEKAMYWDVWGDISFALDVDEATIEGLRRKK